MSIPVSTCALLGRFDEGTVAETAAALLPRLAARGLVTLVQESAPGAITSLARPVADA